MKLNKGDKLVMIGDSITDAGRARPRGEGTGNLGDGYVALTDALISSTYPELKIPVTNMGCGGHTVRDLKNRWQTDALDLKPDWLSIMIGTNDVWRQFDRADDPTAAVLPGDFEAILSGLVEASLAQGSKIVLLTPFYIQTDVNDPMRVRMDEYGVIVKRVAAKYDTLFGDTQEAFNEALKHLDYVQLGQDRVHPSLVGHAVLARTFLNTIDFSWR